MGTKFPSDEWVKMMMEDLNKSDTYLEAAKNWEGDFYFIIDPFGKHDKPTMLYMDLCMANAGRLFMLLTRTSANLFFGFQAPLKTGKK